MIINNFTKTKVIDALNEISDLMIIDGKPKFKSLVYKKAANSIIDFNDDISNLKQLKWIGPSILRDINEIICVGTCQKLERLRKKVKNLSLNINQVKLLRDENIKNYIRKKCTEINDRKVLIPYAEALILTNDITEQLKKLDITKVEICGSLRRKTNYINDLDFVVLETNTKTKEMVSKLFDQLIEFGNLKMSGLIHKVYVEFRFSHHDNWGAMLIHYTGNKFLNIRLRSKASENGMKLNEYGLWKDEVRVAGKTEQEIFDALGIEFIPPQNRQF